VGEVPIVITDRHPAPELQDALLALDVWKGVLQPKKACRRWWTGGRFAGNKSAQFGDERRTCRNAISASVCLLH
jgi:hypothetical protein